MAIYVGLCRSVKACVGQCLRLNSLSGRAQIKLNHNRTYVGLCMAT